MYHMYHSLLAGAVAEPVRATRDAVQDTLATLPGATAQGWTAFGDFWKLVEQAGWLRWPIFAVLAIGLALAISKLYDLLRDRALGRQLLALDVRRLDLKQISERVGAEREHMLAALQSTMLNVFHTRPTDSSLHDEISNFVTFQQNQFERFRRRMEFLSDSAGALGLLGTVWGMFEVFFQGTPDREVILRGMGIALMTTLLGLVVSLILNLAATELFTFSGRRLEQVSKKSDELRFRLLELAAATSPPPRPPAARPEVSAQLPAPVRPSGTDGWCDLDLPSGIREVAAGEVVRGVELTVRGAEGRLPEGVGVLIAGPPGAGRLADGADRLRLTPGRDGKVRFDWTAPAAAGAYALDAAVVGHAGASRRLEFRVTPGAPHRLETEGNHQAAVAGMRLAHPLGVLVRDRFDNPVPGVAVTFQVKSGAGRLGSHGTTLEVRTDAGGAARAPFTVASDAGPNVVVASVEGREDAVEFVAFGTAG